MRQNRRKKGRKKRGQAAFSGKKMTVFICGEFIQKK
jgi:hypothetical protein